MISWFLKFTLWRNNIKFCALCWRPVALPGEGVGRTRFFCVTHKASIKTRNVHLHQKRRILSYLKNKGVCFKAPESGWMFYRQLSTALDKLSTDPEILIKKEMNFSTSLTDSINKFCSLISRFYPMSYKKINKVVKLKNISRSDKDVFVNTVLVILEGKAFIRESDLPLAMIHIDKKPLVWLSNLLRVVARHEALEMVNEFDRKPGPVSSKYKNTELRERLRSRIADIEAKGLKVKQKQLAIELGLSEQRISVLMKEFR